MVEYSLILKFKNIYHCIRRNPLLIVAVRILYLWVFPTSIAHWSIKSIVFS